MYFIGVSGLRVLPLSINGNIKWSRKNLKNCSKIITMYTSRRTHNKLLLSIWQFTIKNLASEIVLGTCWSSWTVFQTLSVRGRGRPWRHRTRVQWSVTAPTRTRLRYTHYTRATWQHAVDDYTQPILQGVSKKVAPPLKLFGIFSLRLSLFAWNFANLLAIHIHIYLPIFVDLS